jgi:hypothetical protein
MPATQADDDELALARGIYASFAATGGPPPAAAADGRLRALAERHVVALGDDGRILMAHPFAAHRDGTRVRSGAREWWGNCAWDAFGIVAALDLHDATITAQGITLGPTDDDAVFEVLVPAAHWWDDIAFT